MDITLLLNRRIAVFKKTVNYFSVINLIGTAILIGMLLYIPSGELEDFGLMQISILLLFDFFLLIIPTYLLISHLESKIGKNFQRLKDLHLKYYPKCDYLAICSICRLPIYSDDELIQCPACSTFAHKTHFLEWMKIKGYCPNCNQTLKKTTYPIIKIES